MTQASAGEKVSKTTYIMIALTVFSTLAALGSVFYAYRADSLARQVIASQDAELGFDVFRTQGEALRIIRSSGVREPNLVNVVLTPIMVNSESLSPRSGVPVYVPFQRDYTAASPVAYRVENYVTEICRLQRTDTECDIDSIAGIKVDLIFPNFQQTQYANM